jgi:hypothetical protein
LWSAIFGESKPKESKEERPFLPWGHFNQMAVGVNHTVPKAHASANWAIKNLPLLAGATPRFTEDRTHRVGGYNATRLGRLESTSQDARGYPEVRVEVSAEADPNKKPGYLGRRPLMAIMRTEDRWGSNDPTFQVTTTQYGGDWFVQPSNFGFRDIIPHRLLRKVKGKFYSGDNAILGVKAHLANVRVARKAQEEANKKVQDWLDSPEGKKAKRQKKVGKEREYRKEKKAKGKKRGRARQKLLTHVGGDSRKARRAKKFGVNVKYLRRPPTRFVPEDIYETASEIDRYDRDYYVMRGEQAAARGEPWGEEIPIYEEDKEFDSFDEFVAWVDENQGEPDYPRLELDKFLVDGKRTTLRKLRLNPKLHVKREGNRYVVYQGKKVVGWAGSKEKANKIKRRKG